MRLTLMLACTMTLFLLRPEMAWACQCARTTESLPAAKWIVGFDGAVFRGKVKRIAEAKTQVLASNGRFLGYTFDRDVTFEVEESWKGADSPEIKIRTGVGNGDCGVVYVESKSYFVVADRIGGRFDTSICTTLGLDMKTIPGLGKGKKPTGK
jgi:hypothetical protein